MLIEVLTLCCYNISIKVHFFICLASDFHTLFSSLSTENLIGKFQINLYSSTSMARTPTARLPWLFRTRS